MVSADPTRIGPVVALRQLEDLLVISAAPPVRPAKNSAAALSNDKLASRRTQTANEWCPG